MNRKTAYTAFLLLHLIYVAVAQNYRPAIRQQLLAVDTIKNDSVALITLEQLVKKENLTQEELLRTNARIILRANATQQFSKSVKLATEGIAMAQKEGLDSLEGMFNSLAAITDYFMERRQEAIVHFREAIRIAQKNNFWEMEQRS